MEAMRTGWDDQNRSRCCSNRRRPSEAASKLCRSGYWLDRRVTALK